MLGLGWRGVLTGGKPLAAGFQSQPGNSGGLAGGSASVFSAAAFRNVTGRGTGNRHSQGPGACAFPEVRAREGENPPGDLPECCSPGMENNHAPTDPDEYADWINRRVGEECRELRERKGVGASALAIPGKLSDQTILNLEKAIHSINLKTLARLARQLGTTLPAIVTAAHARP